VHLARDVVRKHGGYEVVGASIDQTFRRDLQYDPSQTLAEREARHQGALTKAGRYIGGRKTRGRNPKINTVLTPDKQLFTEAAAKEYETKYSKKLERAGYRVLGDGLTDPAKRRRSKRAT